MSLFMQTDVCKKAHVYILTAILNRITVFHDIFALRCLSRMETNGSKGSCILDLTVQNGLQV